MHADGHCSPGSHRRRGAHLLPCSLDHQSGKIEHVRVGRRILISRGALEKFIEMNTRVGYYSG